MDFSRGNTHATGRCLWFVGILTILAISQTAGNIFANYKRCNNGNGICVKREQCLNGQINTVGHGVFEPRMLSSDDFDECNGYGVRCCGLPSSLEPDSGESLATTSTDTTTTEEPEDPDWSRQCGQRTDVSERIDQETETNRFEFPWNVALFSVTKILGKRRKEFLCGGTLIHDDMVITAARCVHQKNRATLMVELGRWDLDASPEPRTQEVAVEQLIIHREYVSSSQVNNIALLILANGVHLGRAANRVCLPDHNLNFDSDSLCYVVGWSNFPSPNTPNRQLKLRSAFANAQECTDSIRRATNTWEFRLPTKNICPMYLDSTVPCERAPGSGLVCELDNIEGQYFLVGIASYAVRNCFQFRAHDVFLKVADYITWIDDHAKNQSRDISFYRPDPTSFE
ncbi:phenoloxidase-activating factor 2-like [Anopheles maculipalpis]|uniref:phenoloxidase-activating factor 2-like n=1 Tax=Anopheles maculipalpis TaxID=1496333 RepID=UPI002158C209|nr:phenoloxidase-activating factor 2-like [Anopheles maculipalpis]